jgi:hypothetical protein
MAKAWPDITKSMVVAALALAIVLGSLFLWIGIPVLLLWAGGQLTSTNTGFLFAALAGIPLAMTGFGWLLYRLNGVYERARGDDLGGPQRNPLLVSVSAERAGWRRAKAPRRLIDIAMTGSAITAMILLVVWFFLFAEMDLAPLGQ